MHFLAKKYKGTEEWKMVRKEKLLKIKRRIEEILDREHSITAKEKSWRDNFFRPLSKFFRSVGITANHITMIGIGLVLLQIWFLAYGENLWGLVFALLAAFSDMIDGPTARFKYAGNGEDGVTALGTFLDHFRDYFLALSFGYFSLFYGNVFRPVEITIFFVIAFLYIGIFLITAIKLRRHRQSGKSTEEGFHGFLLPEMQTTFWGRAQFFVIIIAITALFLARMLELNFLAFLSYIIFGIHIGINFRNLLEEYIQT